MNADDPAIFFREANGLANGKAADGGFDELWQTTAAMLALGVRERRIVPRPEGQGDERPRRGPGCGRGCTWSIS